MLASDCENLELTGDSRQIFCGLCKTKGIAEVRTESYNGPLLLRYKREQQKSEERPLQGHVEVTGISREIIITKNSPTRNHVCTYKDTLDNRVRNLRP